MEITVQIERLEDGTFLVGKVPPEQEEGAQAETEQPTQPGQPAQPLDQPMAQPRMPMKEQAHQLLNGGEDQAEKSWMKPAKDLQSALMMAGDLFAGAEPGSTEGAQMGMEQGFEQG